MPTRQETQDLNERFARFNVNAGAGNDDDDDDEDDEDFRPGDDDEEEDGDEEEPTYFPEAIQARIEKLKELNDDRNKILDQYLVERAALELKFSNLCSPLYDKRREIITGMHDDSIANDTPKEEENPETEDDEKEDEDAPKGVPQFWVTAMSNIDPIAELITEADFECLSALVDIQCKEFDDGKGFTLEFHFVENDFFTDRVLTKRYEIPNLFLADEPILKKVEGCSIHWKNGKCLTHTEVTKKQRSKSGKKAGQIRTITTKEETESFFHFFSPPKVPEIENLDEDEAQALEEAFDRDYDVAQSLRSHVIPQAVLWFTGEALEDDEDNDNVAEEVGAEQDGNAEDEGPPAPLGPSPFGQQVLAPGEQPPECKQN